jgi:hypothetical protein
MSLPSPNLDDRRFRDLLDECVLRIRRSCPNWTDLSPGDPGMVLLELFAHLTEVMIYRLNRVPEKAYVEFLRLMGVKLLPPASASVELLFQLPEPRPASIQIPRGARVTVAKADGGLEAPVFVTSASAVIQAGELEARVLAYHGQRVDGELAGKGSGLPGLTVQVRHRPIVSPLPDRFDLVVGIEALPEELDDRSPAVQFNGKPYRIWREVEDFSDLGSDRFVYLTDRASGIITFAPALYGRDASGRLEEQLTALAEVPKAGREIRIWYLHGGGTSGNLAAGILTVMKDPQPGVQVTNPGPAKGGSPAETLENALLRGPQEIHSLHRAVTARDFEMLAVRGAGMVARAKAFTKAALWKHAAPGTVEVLLVPSVPGELREGGRVTANLLQEQATEEVRTRILSVLDERRPLGTTCLVNWVRYKIVSVRARVVLHAEENPALLKERIVGRLHQTINPLPTNPESSGWRFGQSLRASHVYDIILAEPGVSYVEQVRFLVDEVPDHDVRGLVADAFQSRTWFAATTDSIFRSTDDGEGWERVSSAPEETTAAIRVHPWAAGLIAWASHLADQNTSRVRVSIDCGESWIVAAQTGFAIDDLAWMQREGKPVILLATEKGLYELAIEPNAVPIQIVVDPANQDRGFFAVAVSLDQRGKTSVAVASRAADGVFLSSDGGLPNTFQRIGLQGEDVRVLATQEDGPRRFLWAGVRTAGFEAGRGCFRWELTSAADNWELFNLGWRGGSCLTLAFFGANIVAGTYYGGLLWTDSTKGPADAPWQSAPVHCGLPMREVDRFATVRAVAADKEGRLFMAGGPQGVYRTRDGGSNFEASSRKEFVDCVTLPQSWLFCSGDHEIFVANENEIHRD